MAHGRMWRLARGRYSAIKAVVIGFVMTFFPIFDAPVFWPILLLYWFVLFFVTMKRQIKHMIKYRYIPFSLGKKARPACSCGWPCPRFCFAGKKKLPGAGRKRLAQDGLPQTSQQYLVPC